MYDQALLAHPQATMRTAETLPVGNLGALIDRIEDAIDSETVSIRTDVHFDIKASNARKSRYLYELNRAVKTIAPGVLNGATQEGLERLRSKLEINEAAILAHLNAVKEVAGLLQDAIERAEADGTYSATQFGRI